MRAGDGQPQKSQRRATQAPSALPTHVFDHKRASLPKISKTNQQNTPVGKGSHSNIDKMIPIVLAGAKKWDHQNLIEVKGMLLDS